MNQFTEHKYLSLLIFLLISVVLVGGIFFANSKSDEKENPFCDSGVKICADGTELHRRGFFCDYPLCPKAGLASDNGTGIMATKPADEDVRALINGNNKFAFDLYSAYGAKPGNIFFSPFSIVSALGMTLEGAKGPTADEMLKVLNLPADASKRLPAIAALNKEINASGKKYELSLANALWAQKDYKFLDSYFRTVENYYGGKVTNVDFSGNTEGARLAINSWVEDHTNKKIKNLIAKGVLDGLTRLVLTDAIYFKGDWVKQFDKTQTASASFTVQNGQAVQVAMMSSSGEESKFAYVEDGMFQAVELPYAGNDLSMLVILPRSGQLAAIEASLSPEKIELIKGAMAKKRVDVYLPKFKLETKYQMKDDLSAMGMSTAFSGGADFSGMTGSMDLFIDQVIHQAYIDVNEEGTEAAAATGVVMKESAAMDPDYAVFRADRPFIFAIMQSNTGNILFLGRVANPL